MLPFHVQLTNEEADDKTHSHLDRVHNLRPQMLWNLICKIRKFGSRMYRV